MFSLLSPFALWLAPLLVAPLAIALMGRAQPRTRDFPSLLPVRATLQRAMKRHRLKNWLQLILRTLVLLCVLLAAAGLQWRGREGRHALAPPAASGLLLHNGAYALAPSSGPDQGQPLIAHRLEALRAGLDSLAQAHQGRLIVEPLFTESFFGGERMTAPGVAAQGPQDPRYPVAARFGAPPEAAARLLRSLEAGGGRGDMHAFIPVFAARDLRALATPARLWLEAHPEARLVLLDHGDVTTRLRIFARATATTAPAAGAPGHGRENMLTLRVEAANNRGFPRPPVWAPASPTAAGTMGARETRLGAHDATLTLALPETSDGARWVAGTFAVPNPDPAHPEAAVPEHPVAYRIPPPATLCHVGTREAFVSLASLGEGGERLQVRTLAPAAAGSTAEKCDLLYLADPPETPSAWLARAATVLRAGGTVILEAGRHTDAALWNRNFLTPLAVGRLTEVVSETVSARPVLSRLGAAGLRAAHWGQPGVVARRFDFQPAPGTTIWVQGVRAETQDDQASGSPALLVHRRVGAGRLLLWTTSLSDPAWSDLGLGPWPALVHQGLHEGAWAAGIESREVETDSLAWWPAGTEAPGTPGAAPRVSDPDGNPFRRVREDAGGWWIGPFDRPGLYRLMVEGTQTGAPASPAWLAATLATPPPAPRAEDWAAFREALGSDAGSRVVRLDGDEEWRTLYEGVNLRFALLVLAALLLFAEGVLSLRLAHDTRR